jgi:hypothetical protein
MSSFLKSRWLFGIFIPCVYIIFELGFNHQLLSVTADTVNEETLKGLEFWGRLLSGLGLGLLLFQWTKKFKRFTFFRLIVSLLLGIVLMWNVQEWMTDYWVDAATPEIKKSAFVLAALSPAAGAGKLTTLRGDILLNTRVSAGEQKMVSALFPAASLYSDSRMRQLANWRGLEAGIFEAQFNLPQPAGIVNNAFKNLIVPPLALSFSIFFALFNFAQLTSNLLVSASVAARRMLSVGFLVVLVALSLSHDSSFLDSPGYKNSLRPGLWAGDITLAVLTEWSFRSVARWLPLSEWIHHHALRDFAFGRPHGGSV